MAERKFYAKFAAEVYQTQPEMEIDGYNLIDSTPRTATYRKNNQIVFAVRGTANMADISTDTSIVFDRLKKTKMYRRVLKKFREISSMHNDAQITLTGHSLGGSVIVQLLKDNIYRVHSAYGYNIGMSPRSLLGHFSICFKKRCKREKKLFTQKLNLYSTGADIVSGLSILAGAQLVKPQGFDTHGIANYTRKAQTSVSEPAPEPEPKHVIDTTTTEESNIQGGRLTQSQKPLFKKGRLIHPSDMHRMGLNPHRIKPMRYDRGILFNQRPIGGYADIEKDFRPSIVEHQKRMPMH